MQLFRATIWPGLLPPVTQIETLGPYVLDGDRIKLDLDSASVRTLEVPDELYLRELADLDLDDSAAVVGFTNEYGRLGHRHPAMPRNSPDAEPLEKEFEPPPPDRHFISLLDVVVPDESKLDWGSWSEEVIRHPSSQDRGPVETRLFISNGLQLVDTFRAWAQAFRSLTATYQRYLAHEAEEREARTFAFVIQDLLHPFSPTIVIRDDEALGSEFDPFENVYPRLESVLALQMYRHIAVEAAYLRCDNEPCGRLFVHQRGRAHHGQFRSSGVKYCSKTCAKAQVERERRRRQASKKRP